MPRGGRPAVEVVADTLAAAPAATVAEITERARLGESTVGKALALLEADGRARRAHGGRAGGRRLPDRWTAVTAAAPTGTGADTAEASAPTTSTNGSPTAQPPTPTPTPQPVRLGRGELDALVLDQLRGGVPVTAGVVAKALGRSAGAVSNCLQRLATGGRVRMVEQAPRRYVAMD